VGAEADLVDVSDPDEDPAVSDPVADDEVLVPAVLFATRGDVEDEAPLHAASAPASASTRPRRENFMTERPGEKIAGEMSRISVQMISIGHVTSCPSRLRRAQQPSSGTKWNWKFGKL